MDDKHQLHSIANVIITYDRGFFMQDIQFSSFSVFKAGGGSWLSMFIPIIAVV